MNTVKLIEIIKRQTSENQACDLVIESNSKIHSASDIDLTLVENWNTIDINVGDSSMTLESIIEKLQDGVSRSNYESECFVWTDDGRLPIKEVNCSNGRVIIIA